MTVDLNGKELYLNGQLDGTGTITSSVAGGELHIDVPEGSSTTNATVDFVLDAQSRTNGYRIYSEAEGLRLKRFTGFMILVK